MRQTIVASFVLAVLGIMLSVSGAQSTQLGNGAGIISKEASASSLITEVRDGRRCYHWKRTCADRWGHKTRGYDRCMRRHGCGYVADRRCNRMQVRCIKKAPPGTPLYEICMRRRGC